MPDILEAYPSRTKGFLEVFGNLKNASLKTLGAPDLINDPVGSGRRQLTMFDDDPLPNGQRRAVVNVEQQYRGDAPIV